MSTIYREFLIGIIVAAIAITPCLILLLGLAATR
jgi:hypothetical protein